MKDKIISIISIAIDILCLSTVTLGYFRVFQKAFNKNTLCGISLTLGWMTTCIIGALVLSKDIKKAGDVFGK